MRFKTEKHAREETIGRVADMARAAVREQRAFTDREQRKADALLKTAEALGLAKDVPRDPAELLAWIDRPRKPSLSLADVLSHDPNLKPPKGTKR